MTIEDIMEAWTSAHQEAALREGWDLFTATEGSPVQVQRIDDPEELPSGIATHLPNDETAMMMVRTGTPKEIIAKINADVRASRARLRDSFGKRNR